MSENVEFFREFNGNALEADRQVAGSHVFLFNFAKLSGEYDTAVEQEISAKDGSAEAALKEWKEQGGYQDPKDQTQVPFALGNIQLKPLKNVKGLIVVNGLVKADVTDETNLKYWALSKALNGLFERLIAAKAANRPVELHFQVQEDEGEDWHVVKTLAHELATEHGIYTTVNYAM